MTTNVEMVEILLISTNESYSFFHSITLGNYFIVFAQSFTRIKRLRKLIAERFLLSNCIVQLLWWKN